MPSSRLSDAKRKIVLDVLDQVRSFRFCGPSDDPDEQTAVTSGFRYLLTQLQRLLTPVLRKEVADRLNALNVEINDLFSAFDARAELDALMPDLEEALGAVDGRDDGTVGRVGAAKPIPVPVCAVVGDVLGSYVYHHRTLEALFYGAGATGEVPPGNCTAKCEAWLKRMHHDVADPAAVLGKILEKFMEVDEPFRAEAQEPGRKRVSEVLGRFGLSYRSGGLILGAETALPTKSLLQVLKARDLVGVDKEFERALANVERDPPAAITAACSILESLFRVYIEDSEGLELPAEQSLKPLWKVASKHLGLDPAAIEDDDVKKVLSGLSSVVDGIGSLRTHAGSAHGRGRRPYRLLPRHARLAIHSAHTLVGFFLETWDDRKARKP